MLKSIRIHQIKIQPCTVARLPLCRRKSDRTEIKMIKTKIKWGYIIIGLLLCTIGACFIAFNNSLSLLAITVGIALSAFGVVYGVLTIAHHSRGFLFAVKIIFAVICIVSGIITAIFNKDSVDILISVFCLLLIIDGSFKLNTASMSKRFSVGGWWIMMIVATLVIASSFFLLKFTPEKIQRSSTVLGITIIADAVANFSSTVWVTKYENAEKAEFYHEVQNQLDGNVN